MDCSVTERASEFAKSLGELKIAGDGAIHRIHVIGTSGTGKTTVARRLSGLLGAPCYDLDAIGYAGAFEGRPGVRRPLEDRLRDVSEIESKPAWVIEGIFLWWINGLLELADLIVWLDLHWLVAGRRIVKREIRRKLSGDRSHGLLGLADFVWSGRSDYNNREAPIPRSLDDDSAITRAGTLKEVSRYREKTVRCARQRDVDALLADLSGMATERRE